MHKIFASDMKRVNSRLSALPLYLEFGPGCPGRAVASSSKIPRPLDPLKLDLHKGVPVALARSRMTELDVAKAIRDGLVTSPQKFENSWLFKIRITGTGVAYREQLDEIVWRDPKLYLNEEYLERCNGMPVIWEHPPGQKLDGEEYRKRNIGTVILPFLEGQEVDGIARILDPEAAELMEQERLSTSPAVIFPPGQAGTVVDLPDGRHVLIEDVPTLLDHVAVCELGVWDVTGKPEGIFSANHDESAVARGDSMAGRDDGHRDDGTKDDRRDDDTKDDRKLDKLLSGIDAIQKRMDAQDARLDALERDDGRSRDDRRGRDGGRRDDTDPDEEMRQAAELERLAAEEEEEAATAEGDALLDSKKRDDKKRDDGRKRDDRRGRKDRHRLDRRDDEAADAHSRRVDSLATKHHAHIFAKRDDETPEEHSERVHKMVTPEGEPEETATEMDDTGLEPVPYESLTRTGDERDSAYSRRMHDWAKDKAPHLMRRDGETVEAHCDRLDACRDDAKRRDDARKRDDDVKKAKDDAARARDDAASLNRRLEALERRRTGGPTQEELVALSDVQARADSIYAAHGGTAPRPMDGEALSAYRIRLLRGMQEHSPRWKDFDLSKSDQKLLDIAEPQIFADAQAAAKNPSTVPAGTLREVRRPREGGGYFTEWYGDPKAWMSRFSLSPRYVKRIGRGEG